MADDQVKPKAKTTMYRCKNCGVGFGTLRSHNTTIAFSKRMTPIFLYSIILYKSSTKRLLGETQLPINCILDWLTTHNSSILRRRIHRVRKIPN
jgi:lipoprotein signal peptidase